MKQLRWRVQSNHEGGFDELVVSANVKGDALIHAEMMNDRDIFVSVGEVNIWACVDARGRVRVTSVEGLPKRSAKR
jgi:hypothetical protein